MKYFTTETLFMAVVKLAFATEHFFSFTVNGNEYIVWAGTEHKKGADMSDLFVWAYKKLARIAKDQGLEVSEEV